MPPNAWGKTQMLKGEQSLGLYWGGNICFREQPSKKQWFKKEPGVCLCCETWRGKQKSVYTDSSAYSLLLCHIGIACNLTFIWKTTGSPCKLIEPLDEASFHWILDQLQLHRQLLCSSPTNQEVVKAWVATNRALQASYVLSVIHQIDLQKGNSCQSCNLVLEQETNPRGLPNYISGVWGSAIPCKDRDGMISGCEDFRTLSNVILLGLSCSLLFLYPDPQNFQPLGEKNLTISLEHSFYQISYVNEVLYMTKHINIL